MCCGRSSNPTPAKPKEEWEVIDNKGKVVATKTTKIAAQLAAARLGGTINKR